MCPTVPNGKRCSLRRERRAEVIAWTVWAWGKSRVPWAAVAVEVAAAAVVVVWEEEGGGGGERGAAQAGRGAPLIGGRLPRAPPPPPPKKKKKKRGPRHLIDIATQPDSESTSVTASTSTPRPLQSLLCPCS